MNYCTCGGQLVPVWYTEEEVRFRDGIEFKTGRKRQAVSHLTCTSCFKNHCVDGDYMAHPWVGRSYGNDTYYG